MVRQKVPKYYFQSQKIDGIFSNNPTMNYGSSKKCQNRTFKVNFLCQKLTKVFQKKDSIKNINLGDHFF